MTQMLKTINNHWPLFVEWQYPCQPRRDWFHRRRASSEQPGCANCGIILISGCHEDDAYPQTPCLMLDLQRYTSSPDKSVSIIQALNIVHLVLKRIKSCSTSGAMNSRVPTMEHFTLSIPPSSRASPKSISLRCNTQSESLHGQYFKTTLTLS